MKMNGFKDTLSTTLPTLLGRQHMGDRWAASKRDDGESDPPIEN